MFSIQKKQKNIQVSVSQLENSSNLNQALLQDGKIDASNFIPFTATFEIFTNRTKRIFTDSKYHNQSQVVFIQDSDPSIIHVTQPNITWDYFFKTLPFSLTSDCLITGTKQTFCSNETQKLRFFINDVEQQNALELEINPNDQLRVVFE